MSLGNDLTPVVREESILNGGEITPATRLEYFLAKAAEGGGGGGGSVYSPVLAQTTKSVSNHWVSGFSGGPILEDANYRVIVNGTTYEPLTGTAGEEGYICLGDTYVADSDPSGDYPFGIFYKNNQLYAWQETGDSMTMQIDQIIQAVPVPTPAAADTGKVLTANNGAVEWAAGGGGGQSILVAHLVGVNSQTVRLDKTWRECRDADAVIISQSTVEPINMMILHYVTGVTAMPDFLDPTNITYNVVYMRYDFDGNDAVVWEEVTMSTDNESGYPEASLVQ